MQGIAVTNQLNQDMCQANAIRCPSIPITTRCVQAALSSEVSAKELRAFMDETRAMLQAINTRLMVLEHRIGSLEDSVASLDRRVGSLEGSVASLDRRVGSLEGVGSH